jgi:hypothetical protein
MALAGLTLCSLLLLYCSPPREYQEIRAESEGFRAVCFEGKWGFVNAEGEEIVCPLYDTVLPFSNGVAGVRYSGRWGYVDSLGQLIIPFRFSLAHSFSDEHAIVRYHESVYYINKKGDLLLGPFYSIDTIKSFIFARDSLGGDYALIYHQNGIARMTDWLDYIYGDTSTSVLAVQKGDKWNLADGHGLLFPQWFDSAGFSIPLQTYKRGRKSAFEQIISVVLVVPFIVDDVIGNLTGANNGDRVVEGTGQFYLFSEGCIPVKVGKKWGMASTSGKMLVEAKYDHVLPMLKAIAVFANAGKLGCFDSKGKEVLPAMYSSIESTDHDLIVGKGGRYGLFDKKGKELLPLNYRSISETQYDLFTIENSSYDLGIADKNGKVVANCKYTSIEPFKEGMAVVYNYFKYGYIDKTGVEVIPMIYTDADEFCEGLAAVEKDGKFGYINKKGETVIPFKYEYAGDFMNGEAAVDLNGERIYINKKGEVVQRF